MANSYLNMAATTTAEKVVRRAKSLLRLPSTASGLNFLGTDQTAQLAELTDLVNDAIRDVLDDCPLLNVVEAELTATAGSASTTLPATLRHADILSLSWTDGPCDKQTIRLIQRNEVDMLPDGMKMADYTADPPSYCYLGWGDDTAQLYWLPLPASDRTFNCLYRAEPTKMETTDVGVEGSSLTAKVVPIPDAMMDLLIYKLAAKLARRNTGGDGVDWQVVTAEYEQLATEWAGKISTTPMAQRLARMTFAGMPGTSYNTTMADLQGRGSYLTY